MENRNIYFRADGNSSIGMGHFIRSLALAEMLNDRFNCKFAICQPTDYQRKEALSICQELIELPDDKTHFDKFLTYLSGNEIVVLDNYYFNTDYQRKIKDLGCKLVCIDDIHDKHYLADIVINHAEGINSDFYSIEPYTKLLLGFKYALIRKAFIDEKYHNDKLYDILIGIGGTDPGNLTVKILNAIQRMNGRLRIVVLLGDAYQGMITHHNNIHVFKNLSAEKVAEIMSRSLIGILPSSTIALEACALRLPFITGYYTDNQINLYNGLNNNKLAYGLGNLNQGFTALFRKEVIKFINNLPFQNNIRNNQKKIIDGKSAQRILEIIYQL